MKIETKYKINLIVLFFCLLPVFTWAASYRVSTATSIVDGDTFCGGSACRSSDTIIITGGSRGSILFRDFDGKGSYITIMNDDTNRVVITHDGTGGRGALGFYNCQYIDVRGNNNNDFSWSEDCRNEECYGIKAINDGSPNTPAGTVWVYGKSHHIKLGYIEIAYTKGAKGYTSSGLVVQDVNLPNSWTFDTFEIHHNYIHDTRYAGMYLGHNRPDQDDEPYTANFSIHHNLLEKLGTYGGNLKGTNGGNSDFYNNVIRKTAQICDSDSKCNNTSLDGMRSGFKFAYTYGTYYIEVYNNRIENVAGPCLKMWEANHLVHDNILLGCGSNIDANLGNGINVDDSDWMPSRPDRTVQMYNNIIVQPRDYGIFSKNTNSKGHMERNVIAEAGKGEFNTSPALTEGIGVNANLYEANADDVGFKVWIDDEDYSNDDVYSPLNVKRFKVNS